MRSLDDMINPWLLEEDSDDLIKLRDQVAWLSRHLFVAYEPSPYASFEDRLIDWLGNVPDGPDRRTLFRLLGRIFFIGEKQFSALHQSAFSDAIVRWLIDQEGLSLLDPSLDSRIGEAAGRTWFCPITDSMKIGAFLKVNRLAGHDVRGDWRSFERLGDPDAIRRHVAERGIARIVFLEDFVGSGDQLRDTVLYARDVLPRVPLLLVPLVCCPDGVETGRILARRPATWFAPVLSLRPELFVAPDPEPGEPEVFAAVRDLSTRYAARLGDWSDEILGHAETGALVAMQSNCPDNTLPVVHEQNERWRALFPRVRRE